MKILWRFVCAPLLCLVVCASVTGVENANAQASRPGYVCIPSASGESWDCDEDTGQEPDLIRNKVVPAVVVPNTPAASAPLAPPAPVPEPAPTAGIDPVTGISMDPADWYVPTPKRPVSESHQLVADVPAAYYQQDDAGGYCPGGYRQRQFPHPQTSKAEAFPIVVLADQVSAEIDVTAQLTGNVTIEQGNRLIVAPAAQLDYGTRVVEFGQGVRMDQPGLIMQGEQAEVHLNSQEAQLSEVQFLLTEASLRGSAQTMAQNEDGDLTLANNEFTRCEPNNNGWRLDTQQLVIAKDEVFGTAKHAVLRLKSVPVFYTPHLKFPVSDERVSGFLFPNMGYSDEDGVDFSIPYYFNLAPNYDATLIPRYISDRGAGAELEIRHLSSWQSTILSGGLLPEDDLYNGEIGREDFDEAGGEALFGDFDPADRWLGGIDHRGQIGKFRTLIDYASVSDPDYFRDLGSDLSVSSRRELERKGEVQYASGGLSMRLWAQRFQRLDEATVDDYQRLPELQLNYSRELFGPLSFSLGAKWSEFDRDTDGLRGRAAITGNRTHLEPRLGLMLSRPYGYVNASGGYRYTTYDLKQDSDAGGSQLVDDTPDRSIGVASLDSGLFFERELNWFGEDLVQTLEPRLYYLWQEFDEQINLPIFDTSKLTFGYSQLFRDNRFSGLDRIGDTEQVSAGLTTRFLSGSSGREYFRFSLGEIFYFDDREVTLSGAPGADERQSSSAIASEVSAAIAGAWRVTGNVIWDPHDNQVDEGGAAIQYRRDNRHIFNVGLRNRFDQDIEQTDVSLYWPITQHLSILGRWNYDLDSGRTIEGFGGVEYSDCCLQVRLMARRFLDSPTAKNFEDVEADDGVFLQIVFKGLAGFGTKVESVLERGIRGYRTPQQQDYFTN